MASLVVRLDISALRMQGRRRSPLSKLEVLNANAQKELFNQERFFDLHVRGFPLVVLAPPMTHWGVERVPILCEGRAAVAALNHWGWG